MTQFDKNIKIGDTVVTERFEGSGWEKNMSNLVGKSNKVTEITTHQDNPYYEVHGWYWPASAVRLVPPDEQVQQWKPEWGKEYEFSDTKNTWGTGLFVGMNPNKDSELKYLMVDKHDEPYSYKHIRPILTLSDKIQAEVVKSLTIAYEAGDNNCEMGGNSGTDLKVILDTVAPKLTEQILKVVEGERG